MAIRILALLALFASLVAAPALALLPATPSEDPPAESAPPEQAIDDTQDSGADERIGERIRGFFAEIPAFEGVAVAVEEGVVTLSGTVAQEEDVERAERIAGRVRGVVTVENGIERDLSVGSALDGVTSIGERVTGLVAMLPLIAVAIGVAGLIILIGYLLAGLTSLWHRLAPNSFLAELIASAIRFVAIVLGVVVALDIVGAGALMGAVLGGAGVVGVALGFAMRDTIENYVASLMLSLRQPFRANDHVMIDDQEGRVIRLTSRATVLMTLDGNHLRIPNGQVFKAVIVNFTRNPQRRFEFDLGVDADDDVRAARRLARDTLRRLPFVLDQPAAEVRIVEVGDSNVVIRMLGWIDQREADWFRSQTLAIPAVKEALEEAGFGLPEPIYRLRFDPRSASVPLTDPNTQSQSQSPPEPSTPAPSSPSIEDEVHEVAATDEIAQMVDAERAATGGEQEKDLLDSGRPVE